MESNIKVEQQVVGTSLRNTTLRQRLMGENRAGAAWQAREIRGRAWGT